MEVNYLNFPVKNNLLISSSSPLTRKLVLASGSHRQSPYEPQTLKNYTSSLLVCTDTV